jgi:hypothetical protein
MKAFGINQHPTWKPKAMISTSNGHAPEIFQAMHHPVDAPGVISSIRGQQAISLHRKNFIEEIMLCHLDTTSKLEKVRSLRDHIHLPPGCRDTRFFEQEKKETHWALCLRSSSAGS